MSGVWVFKNNGVMQRVENPEGESVGAGGRQNVSGSRRKALVYLPTGQTVTSYTLLQTFLTGLGWERYHEGAADFFQFHKRSSIDLISLPPDFSRFTSIHMYDIVVKNPNMFHVRDI